MRSEGTRSCVREVSHQSLAPHGERLQGEVFVAVVLAPLNEYSTNRATEGSYEYQRATHETIDPPTARENDNGAIKLPLPIPPNSYGDCLASQGPACWPSRRCIYYPTSRGGFQTCWRCLVRGWDNKHTNPSPTWPTQVPTVNRAKLEPWQRGGRSPQFR